MAVGRVGARWVRVDRGVGRLGVRGLGRVTGGRRPEGFRMQFPK